MCRYQHWIRFNPVCVNKPQNSLMVQRTLTFGQTIMFTPSKAHPKHLSLHPLSRWLVHSLIPRCIHQVQEQELAWQTGMQLSSQNKYRTICYQSAFPQTLLTRALLYTLTAFHAGTHTHAQRQKETHKACRPIVQSWHYWLTALLGEKSSNEFEPEKIWHGNKRKATTPFSFLFLQLRNS